MAKTVRPKARSRTARRRTSITTSSSSTASSFSTPRARRTNRPPSASRSKSPLAGALFFSEPRIAAVQGRVTTGRTALLGGALGLAFASLLLVSVCTLGACAGPRGSRRLLLADEGLHGRALGLGGAALEPALGVRRAVARPASDRSFLPGRPAVRCCPAPGAPSSASPFTSRSRPPEWRPGCPASARRAPALFSAQESLRAAALFSRSRSSTTTSRLRLSCRGCSWRRGTRREAARRRGSRSPSPSRFWAESRRWLPSAPARRPSSRSRREATSPAPLGGASGAPRAFSGDSFSARASRRPPRFPSSNTPCPPAGSRA